MSGLTQFLRDFSIFPKKYEDPRTSQWFLMSSPFPTIFISLIYVYFSKVLGPKFMQNRKPFNLKKILIVYNLCQMLLSMWIFYEASVNGWLTGEYNFHCQPIDMSTDPKTMRMVSATWWYFISKFTEFTETIFFIMRKKYKQVNALHVYHHSIMPFLSWCVVKYYPNGHGAFPGYVNVFVHIVMYFYYLLSACGPNIQKYLWWKKYLTTLQMVQFVVVMFHAIQLLFIDCKFPKIFLWHTLFVVTSFFLLFRDFYVKTYVDTENVSHKKRKL